MRGVLRAVVSGGGREHVVGGGVGARTGTRRLGIGAVDPALQALLLLGDAERREALRERLALVPRPPARRRGRHARRLGRLAARLSEGGNHPLGELRSLLGLSARGVGLGGDGVGAVQRRLCVRRAGRDFIPSGEKLASQWKTDFRQGGIG